MRTLLPNVITRARIAIYLNSSRRIWLLPLYCVDAPVPGWWNGRHDGLKNRCRKVCGFKSRPGHHFFFQSFTQINRTSPAPHLASPFRPFASRPLARIAPRLMFPSASRPASLPFGVAPCLTSPSVARPASLPVPRLLVYAACLAFLPAYSPSRPIITFPHQTCSFECRK